MRTKHDGIAQNKAAASAAVSEAQQLVKCFSASGLCNIKEVYCWTVSAVMTFLRKGLVAHHGPCCFQCIASLEISA